MFTPETIANIPHSPGIYMYHNAAGDIIYVGKARDLNKRVHQYFQSSRNLTPKTRVLVSHIAWIETIVTDSELEALILECNLIKANRPRYNIMLKDDKSYPYIKVTTNEAYPKVIMTRKHQRDGGRYFGPFTSSTAVKQTIEAIGKVYPLRRCNRKLAYGKKVGRPCLNYHIGQCHAPCSGKISVEDYDKDVASVMEILNGRDKAITETLQKEMTAAAAKLDFETAAKKRDQINGIAHIVERQKMISGKEQDQDIIALAKEKDLACVQVFTVRDGKMVGRDHAFMEGIEEAVDTGIMTAFIKQYYAGRLFIPKEIVLGTPLEKEEAPLIEDWLSHQRGTRVTLTVPQKGQKAQLIRMVSENAALTLSQRLTAEREKQAKKESRLDGLKTLLKLEKLPKRIEAYDISNISGRDNVGGMVVFEEGKPNKKAYRRFKIKSVDGQNDYGSMQEMVFRRIERGMSEKASGEPFDQCGFLPFPEVIFIDGGKTHVDAAKSILSMYPELDPAVAGLVKDDHHRLRGIIYEGEEYTLKQGTPLCTFLNEISEEVHRFAIGYHRQLRSKGMLASLLETIPGIGPKRRDALVRTFGSPENIKSATLEELTAIPEMDARSVEAVVQFFADKKDENHVRND